MIFGANFSSESGPEIPVNVSLIIRFGLMAALDTGGEVEKEHLDLIQ